MMMRLNEPETQALGSIADGLAGSDPRLASMLNIFSRLAAGEQMPARENIQMRRGRPAAHRPRRTRRHPRRGTALPQARRLHPRLGWQQAMLLLWVVISAALLAVALVLNTSGHNACTRSMGTACPSPPSHSNANASESMNLGLLGGGRAPPTRPARSGTQIMDPAGKRLRPSTVSYQPGTRRVIPAIGDR
jgi:hypothetical protein